MTYSLTFSLPDHNSENWVE